LASEVPQTEEKAAREEKEVDWIARRKRTLILKGLSNPSRDSVLQVLADYEIATQGEVSRVDIREVKGAREKEWAFLWMASEQAAEICFGRRFNLRESPFYLIKDRSKEERLKMKEQRKSQASRSYRTVTVDNQKPNISSQFVNAGVQAQCLTQTSLSHTITGTQTVSRGSRTGTQTLNSCIPAWDSIMQRSSTQPTTQWHIKVSVGGPEHSPREWVCTTNLCK